MTPLTFLLLAVAGGCGAALRFLVDGAVRARLRTAYPWGTTVINVSGSLLLGLVTAAVGAHAIPEAWRLVAGTGLLGGYTTFSTASYETVRLLQARRYLLAAANGPGMLVVSVAAALVGLALGTLL